MVASDKVVTSYTAQHTVVTVVLFTLPPLAS